MARKVSSIRKSLKLRSRRKPKSAKRAVSRVGKRGVTRKNFVKGGGIEMGVKVIAENTTTGFADLGGRESNPEEHALIDEIKCLGEYSDQQRKWFYKDHNKDHFEERLKKSDLHYWHPRGASAQAKWMKTEEDDDS